MQTVYLGGGTPSLLPEDELQRLFDGLLAHYPLAPGAEVTLEANPDDLTEGYLQALRHTPVNRLSIGIQSFFEDELKAVNRAHTAAQALAVLPRAQNAGFANLTADLIYGLELSTPARWQSNVETLFGFGIPHFSAYGLTVEPRTRLAKAVAQGQVHLPPDSVQASAYLNLLTWARAAGYEAYEISNFAKPGHRSRHNSAYWQQMPYIGLGPSAHSFDGHRTRRANIRNNAAYMATIAAGSPAQETEVLTTQEAYNEYVMTRLRTLEGLNWPRVAELFGEELARYGQHELQEVPTTHVQATTEGVSLTDEGRLFGDAVAAALMWG
jgi:oxygen-independent coproporphyrinogen-3 oxidase